MTSVSVNVRFNTGLVWFPLPVLALVIGSTIWVGRRWDIGLGSSRHVPPGRVYGLALAVTVTGVCVSILQGAWYGMVRETEAAPEGVSTLFRFSYAFVMSLAAAVLAEVTFRGIIQTRFQRVLGVWPAILIVGAINTAAHRWGPDLVHQWLGYFVSLVGLGYLRWYGGSLMPPLLAHSVTNLLLATALWWWGPFDQGKLGASGAIVVATLAIVALGTAIMLGRRPAAVAQPAAAR
jgi:membrane protease YdiL (CAAX protease family)